MMSDFKQTPPLEQPDDGWYLSDAEMDAMTVEELEAAFALALGIGVQNFPEGAWRGDLQIPGCVGPQRPDAGISRRGDFVCQIPGKDEQYLS